MREEKPMTAADDRVALRERALRFLRESGWKPGGESAGAFRPTADWYADFAEIVLRERALAAEPAARVMDPMDRDVSHWKARPQDWPEDWSHENGRYFGECITCGDEFIGHKRRVTCRLCSCAPDTVRREETVLAQHTNERLGLSAYEDDTMNHGPTAQPIDRRTTGLYGKFRVERTDGKSAAGEKHDGCDYFVLDLTHDKFALPALRAYADACRAEYPVLARDLDAKLAAEPAARAEIEEKGWLIELAAPGAPSMYLGRCGWSTPHFAIRYSRKEDAEAGYSLFARVPSPHVRFTEHVWIGAQPAARGEQHEKPEVVSADAASSQDSQSAARPPAPLDDAAVLERAAEILQRVSPTLGVSAITLRQHAEHIRRQPPAPAPEPDVFEAFAKMNDDDPPEDSDEDARRTREWFGPLVEALESISVERAGQNDSAIAKADAALAQLRARAKEKKEPTCP